MAKVSLRVLQIQRKRVILGGHLVIMRGHQAILGRHLVIPRGHQAILRGHQVYLGAHHSIMRVNQVILRDIRIICSPSIHHPHYSHQGEVVTLSPRSSELYELCT